MFTEVVNTAVSSTLSPGNTPEITPSSSSSSTNTAAMLGLTSSGVSTSKRNILEIALSYTSTPLTKKGSHAETKVSHGQNSVLFSCSWFCCLGLESQVSVFNQCQSNTLHRFFSEKKLHKALRSVQFLASFISFYFEILSYLACGEKIIRLASTNSVNLVEKSAGDFYM